MMTQISLNVFRLCPNLKKIFFLSLLLQSVASIGFSKTICTMTFNSSDEKNIFQKELEPLGHQMIELVPDNKDPLWLTKSCDQLKKANQNCDALLISGHFGGLFFGSQRSTTLSLSEMITAKNQHLCPAVFEKPKAVFLMGCNTLSGKTPDHRSVDDYLRVLVGDGFPLDLAENVAAARYLNFGQSMSDQMLSIFNTADFIFGFESTGPLGSTSGPLLSKTFKQTSLAVKQKDLISKEILKQNFSNTNARLIEPQKLVSKQLLIRQTLSTEPAVVKKAWQSLLEPQNIISYFDFIIENQNNPALDHSLEASVDLQKNLRGSFDTIYKESNSLAAIQRKINFFLFDHDLITEATYLQRQVQIVNQILSTPIDYVKADQLCQLFETEENKNLIHKISSNSMSSISKSRYANFIFSCAGIHNNTQTQSRSYECLTHRLADDWSCLMTYQDDLDINSCQLAHSRNSDSENSDDMLWHCYDKMRASKKLSSSQCLELMHSFSLLGNRIKMNWNCQNQL